GASLGAAEECRGRASRICERAAHRDGPRDRRARRARAALGRGHVHRIPLGVVGGRGDGGAGAAGDRDGQRADGRALAGRDRAARLSHRRPRAVGRRAGDVGRVRERHARWPQRSAAVSSDRERARSRRRARRLRVRMGMAGDAASTARIPEGPRLEGERLARRGARLPVAERRAAAEHPPLGRRAVPFRPDDGLGDRASGALDLLDAPRARADGDGDADLAARHVDAGRLAHGRGGREALRGRPLERGRHRADRVVHRRGIADARGGLVRAGAAAARGGARMRWAAWVLAWAAAGAFAQEPPDFSASASVTPANGDALQRLTLPFAAYRDTRRDLADVRVFNANGETVPIALAGDPETVFESPRTVPLPLYPITKL